METFCRHWGDASSSSSRLTKRCSAEFALALCLPGPPGGADAINSVELQIWDCYASWAQIWRVGNWAQAKGHSILRLP
jgi:hypothetical protein